MKSAAAVVGLTLLLGTMGCAETVPRREVIPDSLLVVVLADLHLADARARIPGEPVGLRDSVLAHHGVDEKTFQEAMDGFVAYPDEFTELYNSVLDRLNAARTP